MHALDRLKELSPRQRYGVAGLIVFMGLSAWASVERDLFEGLILLGTLGAIGFAALNHFLPSQPRFRVSFRNTPNPGLLSFVPGWRKRPLDQAAIAQEQVDLAMETMPDRPYIKPPDELEQIGPFVAQSALASLQAQFTGTTDKDFDEFESKVASYGEKLADWVGRLEVSREERLKVFNGKLRVEELGGAPADHVHLRLRFPEGFKLARDLPEAGESPVRPDFAPGFGAYFNTYPKDWSKAQRTAASIPWPKNPDAPSYSTENGKPVVDFELGRINQGDHRDVPVFALRAPGPGSFPVQWEASSSGLGEPATGTLAIECEAAKDGPPITTLRQAEDQQERLAQL
jgi:hypothetical protein